MVSPHKGVSVLVALSLALSLVVLGPPAAGTVAAAEIEVDPGDSIQDAINAAAPGDTIIVNPGTYTGDLTIDKSLTLISSDGRDATTIAGLVDIDLLDNESLVFGGDGAGFTVTNPGGTGIDAEVEYWSSLTITGNTVTDNNYGIRVSHVRYFSELDISGNTITGSEFQGVYIQGGEAVRYHSSASIVDNVITDNGNDGIYWNDIFDDSHGLIEGNTINGNGDDGIWFDSVQHGSSLDFLENTVSGNVGLGIRINEYEEGCQGLIRGNTVSNNGSHGVYMNTDVNEGSELTVEDNTITGNGGHGFRVDDVEEGAYLAILDNTIDANEGPGIYVYEFGEGSEGLIEGNTVSGNASFGIYVRSGLDEGGSLSIEGNTVSGTVAGTVVGEDLGTVWGYPIFYLAVSRLVPGSETVYFDGLPTSDYTMYYSEGYLVLDPTPPDGTLVTVDYSYGGTGIYVGDDVDEGSSLFIDDNAVTDNGHGGIYVRWVDEGSRAVIGGDGNTITGNGDFGITVGNEYYDSSCDEWSFLGVEGGSSLSILNNTISDHSGNGIDIVLIETGSEAVVDGNTVSGNDYGVHVGGMSEGGRLDVVGNAVSGNSSGGVYAGSEISDCEVSVLDNTISGNTGIGLQIGEGETLTDSMATIWCNTIYNNTEWGIYMVAQHSLVDISGNHIHANGTSDTEGGIYIDGSELELVGIHQNSIAGNYDWGLLNDSGEEVAATHNWWGDASGPNQATTNPLGAGDDVSDDVDYADWLTVQPALCAEYEPAVPTPSTLTVDNEGGADYATIQEAIDAADPGDIIVVNVGTYSESPAIDKPLTLLSTDGADCTTIDGTVTIDLLDQETVVLGDVDAGFTVTGSSPGIEADVTFWSHLTITGNIVEGCAGDGIDVDRVRSWSSLSVLDNESSDNDGDGISVDTIHDFSRVDIEGNTASVNTNGIRVREVRRFSELDIRSNVTSENSAHGVNLSEYGALNYNCSAAIVDNETTGNGDDGINWNDIFNNSHGLIEGNMVTGNGDGIYFDDVEHGSSLDVLDNTCADNGGRGVSIYEFEEGCRGLIRGNTVSNSGSYGIYMSDDVDDGSDLIVQDNRITGNGDHGFSTSDVEYGGRLSIEGNTFSGNDGDGVRADDIQYGGTFDLLDNTCADNGGRGVYIYKYDEGAQGLIQGNTITGNSSDGLYIYGYVGEGSRVTVKGNTLTDNVDYGSYVGDVEYGGYLEVVDNLIGDNSDSGIYLYEVDSGAEVRIEGNSITGNEDGIYVADEIRSGGLFNVDGNDVSHNGGVGLWLCGDAETLKDSEAYVLGNSFDANEGWGIYGYLEHARLDVSNCNKVTNNAGGGIYLDGSDTEMVGIHNNNVGGNTGWGLLNESEETLDATSNWWGDTSGPYHPESNAAGVGDQVSGDVAYQPWLMSACDPSSISAGLKASVRTGKPGLVVRFTDLSESGCEIVEWLWDFGDGGSSTEQNPKHTYLKPGVYSVSLTVRDACGYSDTMTMKAHITVKEVERDRTPEPARLGVSYLHIDPLQVLPGQVVNVSANVCNQGEERGTRTVSLMVNGEAVESQSVAVSGGTCQQVTFTVSRAVPGTYQVAIDGMVGQFSVLAPTIVTNTVPSSAPSDGLGTAGIVAIIVVMLVLIAALVIVFRRT